MTSEDIEILKTDVRGRIRFSKDKRDKILAEFDRSGLTAPKFGELTGIKYQTLATWLQKRRRQDKGGGSVPPTASPVRWVEAVMNRSVHDGSTGGSKFLVHLPDGVKLELSGPAHVELAVALIRALQKPC